MTITDWKAEYAKQRKDRLADSIFEYLEDDDVGIEVFYQDLKNEIEEIIAYHKLKKEKAVGALQLILGHREVNLDVEPVGKPNSYEYAAHITMSDIAKFQKGSTL